MGCANWVFYDTKLNKNHWDVWINEIRKPHVADDDVHHEAIFGLTLISLGENKSKTLSFIKNTLGVPVLELAKIIKGETNLLIEKTEYSLCNKYQDSLTQLGATVEVFKDDNAPKKWKTVVFKM